MSTLSSIFNVNSTSKVVFRIKSSHNVKLRFRILHGHPITVTTYAGAAYSEGWREGETELSVTVSYMNIRVYRTSACIHIYSDWKGLKDGV